jgi:hypothetical protein
MLPTKLLRFAPLALGLVLRLSAQADAISAGPLVSSFNLTLGPGEREEVLGPLFYRETSSAHELTAMPPLWSCTRYREIDATETDVLYPILTYDRFGQEYRIQFCQFFSFSGGVVSSADTNVSRFTLFPFYFQQRSPVPEKNYTAVFPFYGQLKNRFFRSEIDFALWPLYVKTKRTAKLAPPVEDESFLGPMHRIYQSRRGDITTYNFVAPIFHVRTGPGLTGWQAWPLAGAEHKQTLTGTNRWGDPQLEGGHEKYFALWPVFALEKSGLGTTNEEHYAAVLPLFATASSPARDSTTAPWPLGFTYTVDRARKYTEWGLPWPFVVFARGEGKTTSRVWPFFSQSHNETLESDFYLWPIYKYNRVNAPPLDRRRARILFYLYSDTTEKNLETGKGKRRVDAWPLLSYTRDWEGNERWQAVALLESWLPASKSIARDYSPVWSILRVEKNALTGASSESFLWNFYRHETAGTDRQGSMLFGLVQWHVSPEGRKARWFYLPGEMSY